MTSLKIILLRIAAAVFVVVSLLSLPAAGRAALKLASRNDNDRSLAGRHRLEFRAGYWDSGHLKFSPGVDYTRSETYVEDLVGAFSYSFWTHDQAATEITLRGLVAGVTSVETVESTTDSMVVLTSAMFGVRLYPYSSVLSPVRPYFSAAIGPYLGIEARKEDDNRDTERVKTLGVFGGYLGGGIDFQIGRHLMAGVTVGYNLMADFPEPLGLKRNYSGVEMSAGISVLFGN